MGAFHQTSLEFQKWHKTFEMFEKDIKTQAFHIVDTSGSIYEKLKPVDTKFIIKPKILSDSDIKPTVRKWCSSISMYSNTIKKTNKHKIRKIKFKNSALRGE